MPRGGARPNSGPKKGAKYGPHKATLSKEQAREALRLIVTEHMRELVDAQLSNAKGIKYLVGRQKNSGKFVRLNQEQVEAALSGEDGEYVQLEVWEKDPSVQAFTDLLNRALDKPKEQVQELSISGALEIVPARLASARKRLAQKV